MDKFFRDKVGIAVFSSSWTDPNALFVSVKAGNNQSDHGNLDLGSFEVHALGKRWAMDLSSEDYFLPGYWDLGKGVQRWTYYCTRSVSHNFPLIDEQDQDEFELNTVRDITWEITTDAEISFEEEFAVLMKNGKEVKMQILSPAEAKFIVESAEQKPPLKPNTGFKRLLVRLPKQTENLRISVLFSPVCEDSRPVRTPDIVSLDEW